MLASVTRSPFVHATGIGLLALALGPLPSGAASAGRLSVAPAASAPLLSTSYDVHDPATWSDRALAAQLTVSCMDVHDVSGARRQAQAGIGGITLLGTRPDRQLASRLATARRSALHDVAPFVMSDEEGGRVQRLRSAIYALPSAQTMGGWRVSRVRRTAQMYAARMRKLGVRMDLAPVADLKVKGAFIASEQRAFSSDPDRVAALARAWRLGMANSGVATVLKHWPGHGSAGNSHNGPASVQPLPRLERRDMRPFNTEMSRGARVVMVGHLMSKGLTEPGLPASESPLALAYLRARAGPDVVILTDALNMAAASSSLHLTPEGAAVRALRAGADWALICGRHPLRAIATVRHAISSGTLPRVQAVASARRILALKSSYGLAPR